MLEKLKNGAQPFAAITNSHGEVFVAAETPEGHADTFATWQLNPADGSTFWGHYMRDRDDALADMLKRAGVDIGGLDHGDD